MTDSPRPHPLAQLLSELPGMAYRCRRDRSVLLASEGSSELTGFRPEALGQGGRRLSDLIHPEDRARIAREIEAALAAARSFHLSYRLVTAAGEERLVWEVGRALPAPAGAEPELTGFIAAADRLDLQGTGAPGGSGSTLTGLPSRAMLMERLAAAIHRTRRRPEHSFAVLSLDLDRFQLINESLGYGQGNQVLTLVARRIASGLRQEDTIAHLGGDHFVVLLDEITRVSDAVRIAQRITDLLALPLYLGSDEVFTSASVGIALGLTGYEQPEDPLRDAEIAMGRAKAQGGGRHQLFDQAMHARAVARLRLETELRHALQRREFRLVYQPIVDLMDGHILGLEALLRWRHPTRGLVLPGEFLATASETGLITPLTWWVLGEACQQLASWQSLYPARPPLFVSVNLTGHEFARPDLVQRVEATLAKNGLDAGSLRLEITEDVVMDLAEPAGRSLGSLDQLGIHLSLDDFGTGYSSLASLKQLPLKSFKIDRSFVSSMGSQARGQEIVRTIVMLAFNLGLEVVAEGVETPEQVDFLLALGCRHAQGFLFAHPLPPHQVEPLLAEQDRTSIARLA